MNTMRQNDDGSWSDAEPIEMQGWKAKLEQRLYAWNFPRLARFMGRWDERGLGR